MKSAVTVLVTGFEPFGGERINPSWEIAKLIPKKIGAATVVAVRLPTGFGASVRAVSAAIERHQPSVVLALGQAGGRAQISVERVAINVDDARIADNLGQQPIDEPIAVDGPAAYFSTLPIKRIVADLQKQGLPAEVSNSAGTFVCNHLMYGLLHHIKGQGRIMRAGFIHVPYLPQQAARFPGAASMTLQTMVAGVTIAIATTLRHKRDRKLIGGALD
jgi:pyroglutamyl-peptidase